MPSVLKCPRCAHRYKMTAEHQGRTVKCKSCEKLFRAPFFDAHAADVVRPIPSRRLHWPIRADAATADLDTASSMQPLSSRVRRRPRRGLLRLALAAAGMLFSVLLVYAAEKTAWLSPWLNSHPSRTTALAVAAGIFFLCSLFALMVSIQHLFWQSALLRRTSPHEPEDAWHTVFTQISAGTAPAAPLGGN